MASNYVLTGTADIRNKNVMYPNMEYTPPAVGIDVNAPLIYMWEIRDSAGEVVGRYIGKANGGEKRPTQHYPRNVNKLLRGLPYKKGKTYRRVHFALAESVIAGHSISLSYLCNVSRNQNIFVVERGYIEEYRCNADDGVGLNGPWKSARRVVPAVTAVQMVATVGTPLREQSLPDLEDFLEYVEGNYPGQFHIKPGVRRYALWIGNSRILRAFQSGPAGKVRIKLAQTSGKERRPVQFLWDGSDNQIEAAIEGELHLFKQNGPKNG